MNPYELGDGLGVVTDGGETKEHVHSYGTGQEAYEVCSRGDVIE